MANQYNELLDYIRTKRDITWDYNTLLINGDVELTQKISKEFQQALIDRNMVGLDIEWGTKEHTEYVTKYRKIYSDILAKYT